MCICLLTLCIPDASAKCGAGTVLYFKFKHEIYLLVADHSLSHQQERGWSGFGGLCDGQAPALAAARETEEETKGFYKREEILAKLNSDASIRVGEFFTFFVEVDYVPAIVINNFKATDLSAGYRERKPYIWMPISEIWQALEKKQAGRVYLSGKYLPSDANTNWLFEPFVISLLAAKSAGVLPWKP